MSQRAEDVDATGGTEQAAYGPSVEWYETDDGVVFYDTANPLAWIEVGETHCLEDAV